MRTTPLLALAALVATASIAGAQSNEDVVVVERPVRGAAGGHVYYAKPRGEFSEFIKQGFGGALHGRLFIGGSGALSLRFDASYMGYGRETVRDQCAGYTCRVRVDVTTSNNIAFVGAGPQLTVPDGPIRPYVAPQAGWTFIWTSSTIEDVRDDESSISDTNISDNTFSYGGLGGVLIPMSAGRNPVALDVGVRYLRNGRVHYLRKGDIIDNPYGPPTLNVQRSRADLLTYFVGLSVAVR